MVCRSFVGYAVDVVAGASVQTTDFRCFDNVGTLLMIMCRLQLGLDIVAANVIVFLVDGRVVGQSTHIDIVVLLIDFSLIMLDSQTIRYKQLQGTLEKIAVQRGLQ